jgi:hypothetical protein
MGMGHGHLLTEEKEEDNEEWEQSLQDGGNYNQDLAGQAEEGEGECKKKQEDRGGEDQSLC